MPNPPASLAALAVVLQSVLGVTTAFAATPNWSGIWDRIRDLSREAAPPHLTDEYEAKYKIIAASLAAGSLEYNASALCLPPGMPYNMQIPYGGEILMTPGQVTIITEWAGDTRRIYTDGRKHPADADLTYQGHSTGRWEGRTLVVDTVGIVLRTFLNRDGVPHSEAMHITERFSELTPGRLQIAVQIVDPGALAEPYRYTIVWKRETDRQREMSEFVCENNRDADRARSTTKQ
jgi:hypothetical protein